MAKNSPKFLISTKDVASAYGASTRIVARFIEESKIPHEEERAHARGVVRFYDCNMMMRGIRDFKVWDIERRNKLAEDRTKRIRKGYEQFVEERRAELEGEKSRDSSVLYGHVGRINNTINRMQEQIAWLIQVVIRLGEVPPNGRDTSHQEHAQQ